MKSALLLLNMGGPNNPDEVEIFLKNMFSDENILPVSPIIRKFIASRIIRKRLDEARENYISMGGSSPLTAITLSLCEKLESSCDIPVKPAMRYVPPFDREALESLKNDGVERLILFPMYPHYSTTTTLSSVRNIEKICEEMGWSPEMEVVEPYYSEERFVDIQVDLILESLGDEEASEYDLIVSAHGLPMKIVEAGDPYREQIEHNTSAIELALSNRGVEFSSVTLAYQSRVGSGAWLEPNLADILRKPKGLKTIVFPISFTVDNSETVFELDVEHREIAEKIGYDDYRVVGCPNDRDDFVEFITEKIVRR